MSRRSSCLVPTSLLFSLPNHPLRWIVAGGDRLDRKLWFECMFEADENTGRSLLLLLDGVYFGPVDEYTDDGALCGHLEDISSCVAS